MDETCVLLARLYVAGGYFAENLIAVDDKSAPVIVRVFCHRKLCVLFDKYLVANRWVVRPGAVELEAVGGALKNRKSVEEMTKVGRLNILIIWLGDCAFSKF
jgi:hypothetical protein